MVGPCLISMPRYAMQCVRKPQRFKDLPISLTLSSTKRVWGNVGVAIETAGVRILRIFVRTLQTKLPPRDTFFPQRHDRDIHLQVLHQIDYSTPKVRAAPYNTPSSRPLQVI